MCKEKSTVYNVIGSHRSIQVSPATNKYNILFEDFTGNIQLSKCQAIAKEQEFNCYLVGLTSEQYLPEKPFSIVSTCFRGIE